MKMNEIEIPKSIKLFGYAIDIRFDKELIRNEDAFGMTEYRRYRINLQPNTESVYVSEDKIAETFFHELIHWILHFMEENNLRDNDKFVSTFSNLLYQAFKMATY